MARVWLVRHGEPSEAVGLDPGLTATGRAQAGALVDVLAAADLVTSPLRRARETAAPLEAAWGAAARVEPAVRELPSPTTDPAARRAWLRTALAGTFADLGPEPREWRNRVVAALRALERDTVVTTHAVVINAALGVALGDDRVLHVRPAHASVSVLDVAPGGALHVVGLPRQIDSVIG